MFKCEIDTGNAAFADPETCEEDKFWEGVELSRVLNEIVKKIENGDTSGSIFDINGNRVGKWSR